MSESTTIVAMEGHRSFGTSTSAPSPGEIESHSSTPATTLSAFSPDEVRGGKKVIANSGVKLNLPPTFTIQGTALRASPGGRVFKSSITTQDPFITNPNVLNVNRVCTGTVKLSPTAASFTPLTKANQPAGIDASRVIGPASTLSLQAIGTSSVRDLTATSVPDISPTESNLRCNLLSAPVEPLISPIGQRNSSSVVSPSTSEDLGSFSNLGQTSRYLMIDQIIRTTTLKEVNDFFNDRTFPSIQRVITLELSSAGVVYVQFADLRDATEAYSIIKSGRAEWRPQYIGPKHFILKHNPDDFLYASAHEGQVFVILTYTGPLQQFDGGCMEHIVKELLENYGGLRAFKVSFTVPPNVGFQVEFFSTVHAQSAVTSLNAFKIAGCLVSITHHSPDVEACRTTRGNSQGPYIIGQEEANLNVALGRMSLTGDQYEYEPSKSSSSGLMVRSSPTGTSSNARKVSGNHSVPALVASATPYPQPLPYYGMSVFPWPLYGLGAVGQERVRLDLPGNRRGFSSQQRRGPPRMGARQTQDHSSSNHNIVNVENIRKGLDVRTTVMLRNIPNKIDQTMLKEIVDETSRGKYDFMYLRIDFANNCNVGYAFINFEDPWFIIDFVNARAGHRWNRYNSDKVAEVSYATIQGKDCLVQKFRNSSVMLEHPSFRPKIFHTGTSPLVGKEDSFPGPDNPSKMRRSVENAEHVGLFAPRAGQHFRDEQRRRRSQYDRGTRLAELEDSYDRDGRVSYGSSNQYTNGSSNDMHEVYARAQYASY